MSNLFGTNVIRQTVAAVLLTTGLEATGQVQRQIPLPPRPNPAAAAKTPVQEQFSFSPTRPRLVVLLHGVTSEPQQAIQEGIATSLHTRWYWGMGLIQGIMGTPGETHARVVQPVTLGGMSIRTIPVGEWHWDKGPDPKVPDQAPIVVPMGGRRTLPNETAMAKAAVQDYIKSVMTPGAEPATAVMVNFRDGSKHLMPQTGATIEQVYNTYQYAFGKLPLAQQPQIYFVGHSFGGVVARAIFANPTGADLFGNKLAAHQRTMADFLRSRTVLLGTLSTPHLGTPMGDQAGDVAAWVRRRGGNVKSLVGTVDSATNTEPLKSLGIATNLTRTAHDGMIAALDSISGERDCLQDLTRMPEYNAGILKPDTGRRRDGGSMIPIFTMSGRSPGATYYDRERGAALFSQKVMPNSGIDALRSGRVGKEASLLYMVQSLLYREGYGKEGKKVWGSATIPEADYFTSPYKGIGRTAARPLSEGIEITLGKVATTLTDFLKGQPFAYGPDGENDSDGFLGFDSGHGLGLPGNHWYRAFRRDYYGHLMPWDLDHHGSMMFNIGTGIWIHNVLLREAGPIVAPGHLSRYPMMGNTPPVKKNISVLITSISDIDDDMDIGTDADFKVYVRIAGQLFQANGADDTQNATKFNAFTVSGLPQSVVPITISVMERDDLDPDDYCSISPHPGKDNVTVYLDTRTGKIYGDVAGAAGQDITATGIASVYNRVQAKFRVTMS
ncbi:MAG TPA: hypothetical protein PLX06_00740 [Fimbriimonadaceae bacterium]|nr:hypothetical protein [Fimbriimonadaceae bacterium]